MKERNFTVFYTTTLEGEEKGFLTAHSLKTTDGSEPKEDFVIKELEEYIDNFVLDFEVKPKFKIVIIKIVETTKPIPPEEIDRIINKSNQKK